MDWLTQPLMWIALVLIGILFEAVMLRRLRRRLKNLELNGIWHRLRDSAEREAAASQNLSEAELEHLLELEKDGA